MKQVYSLLAAWTHLWRLAAKGTRFEQPITRLNQWICGLANHHWADDTRYGAEPVCLLCEKHRGGTHD